MTTIANLIQKERKRQAEIINLIPSENYVSQKVLAALGSVFVNKYFEGYPSARYYTGVENVDLLEERVISLAKKTFKTDYDVNVQSYSGAIANFAIYAALLKPGDKVLSMELSHGGHLSHGYPASFTSKIYKFSHYGVNKKTEKINYDEILAQAKKEKPRLIVCGASAYPREIDFFAFSRIARQIGAYLLADISHIAGLVAAGCHISPFNLADAVMTTTQKTLRGPRGALIFSQPEISEKINRTIFPGLQGGPHGNTIAAIGVALEEALKPSFKKYSQQVVQNAKVLAQELSTYGFRLVSGGTSNHLILIDLQKNGIKGKEASECLEKAGINVNKNIIPFESGTSRNPSGIRLGTPAVTTRGFGEKEMKQISQIITETIYNHSPDSVDKNRRIIRAICQKYPLPS